MTEGIWRRVGNTAVPVQEQSIEALQAIPDGKEFIAITRGARNIEQLKMFWALCTIVAENHIDIQTKEVAKKNLLRALGYVDVWFDHAGTMQTETQSIACQSMTQATFNEFFQKAIAMVCQWLGTAPEEIRKRVAEIVDPTRGYSGPLR